MALHVVAFVRRAGVVLAVLRIRHYGCCSACDRVAGAGGACRACLALGLATFVLVCACLAGLTSTSSLIRACQASRRDAFGVSSPPSVRTRVAGRAFDGHVVRDRILFTRSAAREGHLGAGFAGVVVAGILTNVELVLAERASDAVDLVRLVLERARLALFAEAGRHMLGALGARDVVALRRSQRPRELSATAVLAA